MELFPTLEHRIVDTKISKTTGLSVSQFFVFCFLNCAFPFCCLEKKLDLASVDLSKMRVAELKQILHSWGEECRACAEKTDYVNLITELAPKYAAARPKTEL